MDIDYLTRGALELPGAIGMMSAPGRERDLGADLDELAEDHGCVLLVSLVSDRELELLRISDLAERSAERGIRVIRSPIGDSSTPGSVDEVVPLLTDILRVAHHGGMVAIHCWAGLGRTGLVAACCLVALGFGSSDAIATVRRCRPRAIENVDQEEFVARFAADAPPSPRPTVLDRPSPDFGAASRGGRARAGWARSPSFRASGATSGPAGGASAPCPGVGSARPRLKAGAIRGTSELAHGCDDPEPAPPDPA